MIQLLNAISKKFFDNTVPLSKLSKTFFVWTGSVLLVYITNIFLIRIIGLEEYGKYTVFFSWVSLISTILAFGWDGYIIQVLPQLPVHKEGKIQGYSVIYKAVFTILLLWTILLVVMLLFKAAGIQLTGFPTVRALILFLLLNLLFAILLLLRSFLRFFNRVVMVQLVEDIMKPLLLFAVIFGYYKSKTNLYLLRLYEVNTLVFGVVALGLLITALFTIKKKFTAGTDNGMANGWIRKCFYFMCIYLGYSIFTRMELLFLGYFEQNEAAAQYQILLRISDLVFLPDVLFNYFLPQQFSTHFAHKKNEEAKLLFSNASRTIFLLQLLCWAGTAMVGYWYLQSFGVASVKMYGLLLLLCSAPVLSSFFGTCNVALKTSGNERFSFYALFIVLIPEAVANSICIPLYGLNGAVMVSWLSMLGYNALLSFFVYRRLGFTNVFTRLWFSHK
ncbi:MAG: oligosaccharide flippase family protein [Bacteroidetes bacterium]|nr:oligosaccharide flippase family protein [Bacteroidota bacterium]